MTVANSTSKSDIALGGAVIAWLVIGMLARAAAPTLLVNAPELLAVVDSRLGVQVLLAGRMPVQVFAVLGMTALFIADPLVFALARRHGPGAVERLAPWLPTSSWLVRLLERPMSSLRGAPLIFFGGFISCALAGASGLTWRWFLVMDAIGTTYRVGLAIILAKVLGQVGDANSVVDEFTIPLTALAIVWTGLDLVIGTLRRRRVGNSSD